MIIDAHMHLPSDEPDLESKKRLLLSDIKVNSVDIGIVISDSESESTIGSMDDCAELFSDCPNVYAVAGISPYIKFEEQFEKLKKYLTRGCFVGIKLYCGHEPIYIDDSALKPVFGLAAEFNVPVLFHSGWDNAQYAAPERVKAAAVANPEVRFVCCHCYYPNLAECFEALKGCPNVYFDLSSVADDPEKSPLIAAVLERFVPEMPERFIFGSDYGCCDQRRHIDFIEALNIPTEYRQMLFSLNAEQLYKI
ncbi:MAG: amidohydrolase [Oscillospiraceae bacterium]|nr:amidohydrolase [Oscillospiraceae bacterium]